MMWSIQCTLTAWVGYCLEIGALGCPSVLELCGILHNTKRPRSWWIYQKWPFLTGKLICLRIPSFFCPVELIEKWLDPGTVSHAWGCNCLDWQQTGVCGTVHDMWLLYWVEGGVGVQTCGFVVRFGQCLAIRWLVNPHFCWLTQSLDINLHNFSTSLSLALCFHTLVCLFISNIQCTCYRVYCLVCILQDDMFSTGCALCSEGGSV